MSSQQLNSDPRLLLATASPDKAPNLPQQNNGTSEPNSDTSAAAKPSTPPDKPEDQVPAELITSCVATLLMIQVIPSRVNCKIFADFFFLIDKKQIEVANNILQHLLALFCLLNFLDLFLINTNA